MLMQSTTDAPVENPTLQPSAELIAFVKRQIRDCHPSEDRRSEQRESCLLPLIGQQIDDTGQPFGQPFSMVSRDISKEGIGLVSIAPIPRGKLSLCFTLAGEDVAVIVEISWRRALGPFYTAGGKFVSWASGRASQLPNMRPIQSAMDRQAETSRGDGRPATKEAAKDHSNERS